MRLHSPARWQQYVISLLGKLRLDDAFWATQAGCASAQRSHWFTAKPFAQSTVSEVTVVSHASGHISSEIRASSCTSMQPRSCIPCIPSTSPPTATLTRGRGRRRSCRYPSLQVCSVVDHFLGRSCFYVFERANLLQLQVTARNRILFAPSEIEYGSKIRLSIHDARAQHILQVSSNLHNVSLRPETALRRNQLSPGQCFLHHTVNYQLQRKLEY